MLMGRFIAMIDLVIKLLNMLKKQMMRENAEYMAIFAEMQECDNFDEDAN